MRKVTMRHPDVEQPITVAASAVPVWSAGGWVESDEPAPAPKTNKTRKAPRRAAGTQEETK